MNRDGPPSPGPAGQVLVQPVQGLPGREAQAAGGGAEVGPGPDGEGHFDAAGAQPLVLLHRLVEEQVQPPADEQHRHPGALQGRPEAHRRPEGVGQIGPGDPVGVPGGPAGQLRTGHRRQGQPVVGGGHTPPAGEPPGQRRQRRILLVGDLVAPAEEVQAEGVATPDVLGEVVGSDSHHRRGHPGRRVGQQGPLGEAEIGGAEGGEASGEPGLRAHPGDHVATVVHFGAHGVEAPAGAEGAAGADEEDGVAPGGVDAGHGEGEGIPPAVGSAHEDGADRGGWPAGTGRRPAPRRRAAVPAAPGPRCRCWWAAAGAGRSRPAVRRPESGGEGSQRGDPLSAFGSMMPQFTVGSEGKLGDLPGGIEQNLSFGHQAGGGGGSTPTG